MRSRRGATRCRAAVDAVVGRGGLTSHAAAAVLVLALTGCGGPGDAPRSSSTGPTPVRPTTKAPPTKTGPPSPSYSGWELGAHPLPLRPDGLGEMGRTPPELVERRFPTRDLLPPPSDGRFHSTIGPVTAAVRRRMGTTWSPRCPVDLDALSYLTVSFRGFDRKAHTGELVVASTAAGDVVSVFEALFSAGFPIEEMRLPTTADLEAHPTGDGNNTAALVCRATTGGAGWSAHAYGLAIDLNPFNNPYAKGDVVLPELASSYLDRSWQRPGMIQPDSLVVREFARIGWSWGGSWSTLKDYQHFTATGR
jgi:hypothetical protein